MTASFPSIFLFGGTAGPPRHAGGEGAFWKLDIYDWILWNNSPNGDSSAPFHLEEETAMLNV